MSEYWEMLFGSLEEPCFVAQADNDELIYLNRNMELVLGEDREVLGEKYYNIIQNNSDAGHIYPEFDWEREKIHRKQIYDRNLNMSFAASVTQLQRDGQVYLFIKCVPMEKTSQKDFDYELAMTECADLLSKEGDLKIQGFLAMLGDFYEADKCYLFQIDREASEIFSTNYWLRDTESSTVNQISEHVDVPTLVKWFHTKNEMNIIEVDKEFSGIKGDTVGLEILDCFKIDNIFLYIFMDGQDQPTSVLVVTNRKNKNADFRLMQVVSRFLEMDVSRNEASKAVEEMSDRDLLTGFFSRISYSNRVVELSEHPPKNLGVVFANINGLKQVNSEFGYAKGDSYIKKAAKLIENHFSHPFYRISGDEFVAFFPEVEKEDFEQQVVALGEDMIGSEHHYLALGHAWSQGNYSLMDLVKEADTVMYINKQEYYHESHRSFQDINDSTLADLLSYLENDEFMIYLQPQVYLEDGSLYGAEALIRRFDKVNQKMVFPDQFIPLYEKKSVIRHVDIFVVEQVCRLLADWYRLGKELPISVNLSRVTLLEYGIVETISKICDKYAIPRHLLVIEVTERVGLIENNVASSLILDFIKHGFHISLDDFGCAYSNIVTLAQIDVDEVKLDKSLVDNLVSNNKNRVLVRNVLRMCNELEDTSTLAEGIEEEAQGLLLHALGCDLGQGYFYSRPIPVDEFCAKFVAV